VADSGYNLVMRVDDMTGAGWTIFGLRRPGDLGGFKAFYYTQGIFVDGAGHIYVADGDGIGRVVRMDDMIGSGWTTLGPPDFGKVKQFSARGIYVDGTGRIYVADNGNQRIVRVDDMTGRGWTTFGHYGNDIGGFYGGPSAISLDGAGRIYVLGLGVNWTIARIDDMTGKGWTTFGTFGTGVNQFGGRGSTPASPNPAAGVGPGLYVDRTGRIYVADSGNNRITRMDDMTGAGWMTLGSEGAGVNQFTHPSGIFVDKASRIYVADSGNNRIVRVNDMLGAGWATLGGPGRGTNQFSEIQGICVDETGRIYVADMTDKMFTGRIARVNDITGAGWTTLDTHGVPLGIFVR
jgi:streptogramin lyase